MKSVIFNDHRKNCKKLKFLKNDFLNFWLDFSIKKLKKMKKKQKIFSAPARLADALAGRTLIPGCDSEGFFLPFLSAYCIIFLPAGVRSASGRRRVGVGSASGRRGVGAESEFSGRGFVVRNRF